ncbi:gamma-aminobutyraldehyde dehydrogenase [Streptomyces lavendulae subsp. lavendulae]|uniref:aminobutyraldehyde dehydrogenase n=1 Tax=Streptomyces lavendulae TaxID=1914 RepID=UPI0024A40507|nr:aminobutyraldehyde dehydrogenase [Streptomyces lavendulae]GLV84825.1 gamma-aminobutyraldehyde dehydrogenase [Streptomyces lavendulae subsp. lavendulae]
MSDLIIGNFVNGRSVDGADGGRSPLIDPATEEQFGEAVVSGEADVRAATAAAAAAFPQWRSTTPGERARALLRLADALEDEADAFVALESANTGKPLGPTLDEEVLPAIDTLRFYAGAARMPEGRASGEYLAGHTSSIRREPVGVCAQITPWNYPLMMAAWKIGPALAAGNTVVLKPAETTPVTTLRLAEIAAEFLPPGVLNVVCGGRDTGRLLVAAPEPAMVSLTGSTRAGREVAASAANGVKRLHLELGGNAAVVVCDDADVEAAADAIAEAAYFNAGQDCVAASRVIAGPAVHADLVDALAERAKRTVTAPPSDPTADYGPLNNAAQLHRLTGLIEGLPARARIVTGGHQVGERGYFYAPTVITGVEQDDAIVQEEIFGPVVTVQRFTSLNEAIALANGVPQGLACSLWTRDHSTATQLSGLLDFGCVWINTHLRFATEMPHGGFKSSGYGKDLSAYAMDDYTRIKHVMTAFSHQV